MPDGYLIDIGVKADFSDLKAKQKEASATVKQATIDMANAYAEWGARAAAGDEEAIASLKLFEAELASAKAKLAGLETPVREATDKMEGDFSRTEARHAAHMLGMNRAVGSFAATLPGVGAAMSMAFAPLAIMEMVEWLAKGLGKLEEWREASKKLAEAEEKFKDVGLDAFNSVDEKIIEAEKKTDELAGDHLGALQKQLKLIDMATMKDLVASFAEITKSADEFFKAVQGHWYTFGVGSDGATNALKDFKGQYDHLLKTGDEKGGSDLLAGTLDSAKKVLAAQEHMSAFGGAMRAQEYAAEKVLGDAKVGYSTNEIQGQRKLVDILQEQISLQGRYNTLKADSSKNAKTEEGKKGSKDASTAGEKKLKADESELVQEQLAAQKAGHAMTVAEELSFWNQRLAGYKGFASQYDQVNKQILHLTEEAAKQQSAAVGLFVAESIDDARRNQEENQKSTEAIEKYQEDLLKADEEEAEETKRTADTRAAAAAKVAEATIQHQLATGAITQEAAADALAAVKTQEYTDKLAALEAYLLALQQIQGRGGDTGKKQQSTQNEITSTGADLQATKITSSDKSAKDYQKNWDKALSEVGKQFTRVQDEMLKGQISIATGAKRMCSSMALDFVHYAEQAIATDLRKDMKTAMSARAAAAQKKAADALAAAAHTASNTAVTTSDTASAATSVTATTTAATTKVAANSAVAGTGAAASVASIPIVGPALAAVAGPAMMALCMAMMKFESGGIIPGSIGSAVPILGHAGEAVLPQPLTKMLTSAAKNGSTGSSGSVTNNNTFNGVADQKTFAKMLTKNNRAVASAVKRAARNGHF
jgi:hypothetical protein